MTGEGAGEATTSAAVASNTAETLVSPNMMMGLKKAKVLIKKVGRQEGHESYGGERAQIYTCFPLRCGTGRRCYWPTSTA